MNYYRLGRKYTYIGKGVSAKAIFHKGVKRGCLKCTYGLFALKMSKGENAHKEWECFVNALDGIQENAEKGDMDSCFIMGRSFETGCGGVYDIDKAITWYKRASKLGSADAMFNLGCIYYENNKKELGTYYYKLAANLNLKEAQYNLGHIYELKGNKTMALLWYKRARRCGKPEMKEKYIQFKMQY